MSPKVQPKPRHPGTLAGGRRSSYAEFRSLRDDRPLDRMNIDDALASVGRSSASDRAFWRYVTSPMTSHGNPMALLEKVEHRALSRATAGAGGYLVPSDFAAGIESARRASSVIGAMARVYETDDGTSMPIATTTAHGASTWTAENASFTASDETFGQVTLSAFKASTRLSVSEELLQDASVALDEYLADELGRRLAVLEDTAFAVGDGAGKPLGVAHASSGIATVTAATGSATGFKLADVRAVYDAVPAAYRPNASWVMSPSAFSSLAGLTDTAGGLVFGTLHAAQPTLYARPVYVSADMPTAAANARSVVFGDFRAGYAVRRVREIGMQRQDEISSDNGQVGFRAFERVDGRVVLADALRILVHSAT